MSTQTGRRSTPSLAATRSRRDPRGCLWWGTCRSSGRTHWPSSNSCAGTGHGALAVRPQPVRLPRRPRLHRRVAHRDGAHLRPAEARDRLRTVLGNGMLVARGRDWRRKRSLVQPSVRPKQVRVLRGHDGGLGRALADRWSDGQRGRRQAGDVRADAEDRRAHDLRGGHPGGRSEAMWAGRWTSPRWRSARSSPGSARCSRLVPRRAGRASQEREPPPPCIAPSGPGRRRHRTVRRNAPTCSAVAHRRRARAGRTHLTGDDEIRDRDGHAVHRRSRDDEHDAECEA